MIFLILPVLLFLFRPALATAEEKPVYTLGVVPQLTPLAVHRAWAPLVGRLSTATGAQIRLKTYQTIPEFESDLMKGKPDFAFMNPLQSVTTQRTAGYIPLVRSGTDLLRGVLVVRRDSSIQSVQELNGREVAFPAPNALAASLYLRALLTEKEKISFTSRYVLTHTNVYRYVILGLAPAGGGANTTLTREPVEVRAQVRVIYETPGLTPHPLCAHPRVPAGVQRAVTESLPKMAEDEEGRRLLESVQLSRPVKAVYARDYQPIERLGLEKYLVR